MFALKWLSSWLLTTCVVGLGLTMLQPVDAATFSVINLDGAGEGFNDPAPFTLVGGNNATTVGQARLNAFGYATGIWSKLLTSNVTIQVGAQMDPLEPGLLGQAGPNTVHRNFPNVPVANVC